jgi:hypothetical protein
MLKHKEGTESDATVTPTREGVASLIKLGSIFDRWAEFDTRQCERPLVRKLHHYHNF